jgi:transposase
MLLMSAEAGLKVDEIGRHLGCQGQTVREAIHAFHQDGLSCLQKHSRSRHDDQRAFDDEAREQLRELIRRCPRDLGYETNLWTLDLLAQVSFEQGLVATPITGETVRATLASMGIGWRRAKHWITSPDEHYQTKKNDGIGSNSRQISTPTGY